ncbi:hypothetical protein B0T17DRAFT_77008 [Bombardia bombarda]|uniref:Secreted protein n=1 Tax=Bombardia bombarda TaxID=252184 RepID=A0AA39XLM6_9PEZI|nr:hypothetical protein B0T17DRAFT_77008 [Bombardia bombarda]
MKTWTLVRAVSLVWLAERRPCPSWQSGISNIIEGSSRDTTTILSPGSDMLLRAGAKGSGRQNRWAGVDFFQPSPSSRRSHEAVAVGLYDDYNKKT